MSLNTGLRKIGLFAGPSGPPSQPSDDSEKEELETHLDPYLRLHRPLHTLLTYKSRCIWHSQAKYARTGQSLALLLVLRNPCLGSMMR